MSEKRKVDIILGRSDNTTFTISVDLQAEHVDGIANEKVEYVEVRIELPPNQPNMKTIYSRYRTGP